MKSQERIKSEFKGMSAPQLVILSGILLNTLLAVVLLAQLSGLSALKASLDSSFSSIEQRINATLATTQVEIQSSVSSAVEQINSSGTALSCSGSYTGSINFPSSPYSYFLSGSVSSFGSMTGTLRSNSPSLPSFGNDSTGTISLDCR
jgi:Flp pilus assembly pilin Flp